MSKNNIYIYILKELFSNYDELTEAVKSVDNSGGVYFVPAFSGLYSPYWDESATG